MAAVVGAATSLLLLGVEYAGNVGRTVGAVLIISFGGSLSALAVLTGIRAGDC